MWPLLFTASLWGCGLALALICIFGIFNFTSEQLTENQNRLLPHSKKAFKYCIFLLLFFCFTAPLSFYMCLTGGYIYPDNYMQKTKSHTLENSILSRNENLRGKIAWSPALPKTCLNQNPKIEHSKCLNFTFEIDKEQEIFSTGAQVLEAIRKSTTQHPELSGNHIAITPIKRRPNCAEAQITPYQLGKFFIEYHQVLIKIESNGFLSSE